MAAQDERAHTSPAAAVLYRRLLALHTHDDPEPMLDDAIRLIVELTGAQLAIIELFGADGQPNYWRGHGRTIAELGELRDSISHGIVRHAIEANETVLTTSAVADERFSDLDSVRQGDIQAVLCSQIGDGAGVVYLQGRAELGSFSEPDCDLVELTADHLAEVRADLLGKTSSFREKTVAFQRRVITEALERHKWNKAAAARELDMFRSQLNKLIAKLGLHRK